MTGKKETKPRRITYRPHPDPIRAKSGEKVEEKHRETIFMDADRQKLELDITQEFEFADGEATSLIDKTK